MGLRWLSPKLPVRAATPATESAPPALGGAAPSAAAAAATIKPSTTAISALRATLITSLRAARVALRGIVHWRAFVCGRSAVAPTAVWLLVIPLARLPVDPLVEVVFPR